MVEAQLSFLLHFFFLLFFGSGTQGSSLDTFMESFILSLIFPYEKVNYLTKNSVNPPKLDIIGKKIDCIFRWNASN